MYVFKYSVTFGVLFGWFFLRLKHQQYHFTFPVNSLEFTEDLY